jgi:hypothetical protein
MLNYYIAGYINTSEAAAGTDGIDGTYHPYKLQPYSGRGIQLVTRHRVIQYA